MDTRTTRHRLMLDVGGTFIKCSDGRSIPVDSNGPKEKIVSAFRKAVGDFSDLESISVAIPGPFDYEKGIFLMKHKFASVYGESFAALAGVPDNVGFSFIHDVNCMLLGEMTAGAARGYKNVALITIGTGLGFGMATDGRILKNAMGSPAFPIYNRPYGEGILEDYVSKRGISRLYDELSGKVHSGLTVKEVSGLARSGDTGAIKAFHTAGSILGQETARILEDNGIECLLLGGQISKSFDLMKDGILQGLEKVGCLKMIGAISDFDSATFNGLLYAEKTDYRKSDGRDKNA